MCLWSKTNLDIFLLPSQLILKNVLIIQVYKHLKNYFDLQFNEFLQDNNKYLQSLWYIKKRFHSKDLWSVTYILGSTIPLLREFEIL